MSEAGRGGRVSRGFRQNEKRLRAGVCAGCCREALRCLVREKKDWAAAEEYCLTAENLLRKQTVSLTEREYQTRLRSGALCRAPLPPISEAEEVRVSGHRKSSSASAGPQRHCGFFLLLLKVRI